LQIADKRETSKKIIDLHSNLLLLSKTNKIICPFISILTSKGFADVRETK